MDDRNNNEAPAPKKELIDKPAPQETLISFKSGHYKKVRGWW